MARITDALREIEFAKYVRAYASGRYRMGDKRRKTAIADLGVLIGHGSLLDVGCGHGEMLKESARLGFAPVRGTEVVPELLKRADVSYAEAHALPFPDNTFDVVTMFDVIEHLIPGDDEAACRELRRVARNAIFISANKHASTFGNEELHINRRSYEEWDALFRDWFAGWGVAWLDNRGSASETWLMTRG